MKDATPKTIFLKDYKVPDYLISESFLRFELDLTKTKVSNTMKLSRTTKTPCACPLKLNGENLKLLSLKINGELLESDKYSEEENILTIDDVPEEFTLEVVNEIDPSSNTALDGLYTSGGIFCSQNEPEGFRRITYFIDRPDVMTKFTTQIIADKEKYPLLLSNGNPIKRESLEGGLHSVTWEDPFPKPCYLFALVAGDLGIVTDTYTTISGREVKLEIFCDKGNESRCDWAMQSLKNSMKWDEEVYGLEYDLDIYMIVAVDSFNMGAMENKGLNIFNSRYVLADSKTATDYDYMGVEGVIGHEYFHNWTGNRVTCRDWFQLTLKEGLTVFRDQEFSADMNSRAVKRIEDVSSLRARQFVEDSGPTSHPIKPNQYIEINNFYTSTIYEKGAEIIRMIHTLLGRDNFRKGMDLYFQRHDGKAVCTEDFIDAMVDASGINLDHFKTWYSQSGTPQVQCLGDWNEETKEFTLKVSQLTAPTADQPEKTALFFPFKIGLVDEDGKDLLLVLENSTQPDLNRGILHISKAEETFVFKNVDKYVVASLNRDFSAPVVVNSNLKTEDKIFLLAKDPNNYNRYETAQEIAIELMMNFIDSDVDSSDYIIPEDYVEAYGKLIDDETIDPACRAYVLSLPNEGILFQRQKIINIERTATAISLFKTTLVNAHWDKFLNTYNKLAEQTKRFEISNEAMGMRSLKSTLLSLMASTKKTEASEIALKQFNHAENMSDEFSALRSLSLINCENFKNASDSFYKKWSQQTLVIQKWLSVQALVDSDQTIDQLLELENDQVYDKKVPNLVRSLIGAFLRENHRQFNKEDGSGYRLIADRIIEMDSINPSMASGLASGFRYYSKMPEKLKSAMKVELERILSVKDLSKNTYEIVSKTLA